MFGRTRELVYNNLVNTCITHSARLFLNDPSAGSPTETLLRLLLPLSIMVYSPFPQACTRGTRCEKLENSPEYSIGRSDGRCVQRAGT